MSFKSEYDQTIKEFVVDMCQKGQVLLSEHAIIEELISRLQCDFDEGMEIVKRMSTLGLKLYEEGPSIDGKGLVFDVQKLAKLRKWLVN